MKEDGKDSLVNKAYSGLGELLRACGFKEKIQKFTNKTNNNAGINCLIELLGRIERMNLQKLAIVLPVHREGSFPAMRRAQQHRRTL